MKKVLLIITLLSISFSGGAQQYTAIPDLNFETKLIALGIDSGVIDHQVLTSKINTLMILDVSNNNIADLTGIEAFIALKKFDCSFNEVTTLNVTKNTALTDFRCANNQLTNLDVFKNVALTDLRCDYNQLTNLDVSQNTALTNLYCHINKLTALDVSKNTALTTLSCTNNQISILDVSKNIALSILYCDNNKLTALDLSNNIFLSTFYCNTNKLVTLDVSKCKPLHNLQCYSNQLTTLDVSQNTSLHDFNCNSNLIITLDVTTNTELYNFNCSSNLITSLDVSKTTMLSYFDCSTNQLNSLNLKNGRNNFLQTFYFGASQYSNFINNPNLTCIQVDDKAYSDKNWSTTKDATAAYNTDCLALGINETVFATLSLYPIPAKEMLHIDNVMLEKATLYDSLGRNVKTVLFTNTTNNIIPLSNLSKGLYYIYLQSGGATTVRKINIE
jgi:Secretion system C-terminal sorting domain